MVIMPGMHASELAGVATAPDDSPLPMASVIRFACGKERFRGTLNPSALEQLKSDQNGKFAMSWHGETRACLQFQTPGFNTLQIEVIKKASAGRLHLKLSLGT